MKKFILVLLAMLVGMTMIMTACGSTGGSADEPMTLEKYVQGDAEVQQSIDNAMADSNVLVEIKENAIIYTFDLATMEGYTEEIAHADAVKDTLQSALDSAGGTFGGIAKSIEDSTGIAGITCVVNYTWGDEVIVTKTYTSADATE